MSFLRLVPLLRHVSVLAATVAFAYGAADAQFAASHNSSADSSVSSSESSSSAVAGDASSSSADASPSDPGASGAAAAQENGGYGRHSGGHESLTSRLTFDLGAGFNAPIGNDTSTGGGGPFITWGGNFTLGGGLRFSKRMSVLGEYQFMDDKLPGSLIAEGGGTTGNTHINSLTVDPVIDITPKWKNGLYAVGGFGWYHKSTNFNVFVPDEFGFLESVTANSFSSDQIGANFGLGFQHRLGGMYGDSKTRLFAEARYTYIHTPPITQDNGLGTTEVIPVTLGVRF